MYILVSIHAPTRGATQRFCRGHHTRQSFNPRTHTGCDMRPKSRHRGKTVSIHAPTRGATPQEIFVLLVQHVSIHAPTRGATADTALAEGIKARFNPRTHTGCDVDDDVTLSVLFVSIHAPTRGAT